MRRILLRAGAALAAVGAVVLATASPAAAHVTVNAANATQGGYAKVAFRVPNERDNAGTVKLEISLPADAPVASVSLRPQAGWTATTEKTTLATPLKVHDREVKEVVSKITWTADKGVQIKPGEFQEFEASLGPLPEVDQLIFKALQTYSTGEVVRWIDEPATDGSSPEHPAPVLKLAKATGGAHGAVAVVSDEPHADAAGGHGGGSAGGDSSVGTLLGLAGLVLGLAGLVVGLLAYRRAATSV
ncbi:YcnI family protein [Luedemannella flava]|uniref:YcnI family protein n=1 Tax=Luedemannella flava TaxID=349316 RepID=A0ABP4YDV4_9ACTN